MTTRLGGFSFEALVNRQQTSDQTPTLTGVVKDAPGATITITVGDVDYSAVVAADHTWSVTTDGLASGTYTVTVSSPTYGDVDFEDVLRVLGPTWAFHDGASGLDDHTWRF